jgi:hypothetical protein
MDNQQNLVVPEGVESPGHGVDSPADIVIVFQEIPLTLKNFYENFKDQLTESDCQESDESSLQGSRVNFDKINSKGRKALKSKSEITTTRTRGALSKVDFNQPKPKPKQKPSQFVCSRCNQEFRNKSLMDRHTPSYCDRRLRLFSRRQAIKQEK